MLLDTELAAVRALISRGRGATARAPPVPAIWGNVTTDASSARAGRRWACFWAGSCRGAAEPKPIQICPYTIITPRTSFSPATICPVGIVITATTSSLSWMAAP